MLGMLEDAEKRHPKLIIGVSAAAVMSVFLMGGQLTLHYGGMLERMKSAERRDEQLEILVQRIEAQRSREHNNFIQRDEYMANNAAVLRELQSTQAAIRDLTRQVTRIAEQDDRD